VGLEARVDPPAGERHRAGDEAGDDGCAALDSVPAD